jgi:hypothetical protein
MLHSTSPATAHRARLAAATTAAALLMALTACGGGTTDAAAGAAGPARSGTDVSSTLMDDEGRMQLASVQPRDAGARTRSTGYATEDQARQLEAALGADVLSTEVDCCGAEAADLAVLTVWGLQAARDLPGTAPVLVRGADQRLAATVAQRLADGGFTRVWLVLR